MIEFWDMLQRRGSILSAERSARARQEAVRADEELHGEILKLESKVNALALVCEAMWELLSEKTGLDAGDISRKMDEIDSRDGRRDGRMITRPSDCQRCLRPIQAGQDKCIYCGDVLGTPSRQSHS